MMIAGRLAMLCLVLCLLLPACDEEAARVEGESAAAAVVAVAAAVGPPGGDEMCGMGALEAAGGGGGGQVVSFSTISADGSYVLQVETMAAVQLGRIFAMQVQVAPLGAAAAANDTNELSLQVAAAMPQHGHGMNVAPEVEALGGGGFAIDGMMLHMPGKWELYFDITRGGITERAQHTLVVR